MESRIEDVGSRKLVGMRKEMSFAKDQTAALWKGFMRRKGEVKQKVGSDVISMQVYKGNLSEQALATRLFDKWAVVEVKSEESIPDGMESYILEGGKYAVFLHHGPASDFPKTMQFIFDDWLPKSNYELDQREHFEILPEGYSPADPEAREEIWIPIK